MDNHNPDEAAAASAVLSSLSSGQVEVMERVVYRMTSKEIARELEISPNTVDQRVKSALRKLGASDRIDGARKFTELCAMCGRTIYGSSVIDFIPRDLHSDLQKLPDSTLFALEDSLAEFPVDASSSSVNFLEVVDRRLGRPGRVALIVVLAVGIAVLGLVITAIGKTLSELL